MKRVNKINRAKEKAKNTPISFVGVNIAKLNSTNEEKRQLVSEGFYFSANRKKETRLHYLQDSRARDIREKVNKKRILKRKTVKELVEIAKSMNIEYLMTRPRSNNGNDTYTDYVTVSKDMLIERIINKRSFDIYKGEF